MRLLMVTQYYWPEDFSAGIYMPELAESLCSRGHEVQVLTGFPNYPHGRILPGYRRRVFQVEERRGVRVIRTWIYPSPRSSGGLRRGATALSFALSAVLARGAVRPPDVVLGFSPPPFMGLAALSCARRFRVPLLLNVKDLFTEAVLASGLARPGPLARALSAVERRLYRSADRVIAPVRDFLPVLAESGVAADSLAVIPDWADGKTIRPQPKENPIRREWGCRDRFVILYSGSIGYSSCLEPVLRAAALLREDPRFVFLLVGDGPLRAGLEMLARELELPNVQFHPLQSRERFPEVLAAADVTLVTLSPSGGRVSTQGKLYSLLAAGRPVLGIVPPGNEAARVIEENGCGWSVSPQDPSALAALLRLLPEDQEDLERRGASARSAFEAKYSLAVTAAQFEAHLRELAFTRPDPGVLPR